MEHRAKPVVLLILDGWGMSDSIQGNAIALAQTPVIDRLYHSYPHTQLLASGDAVGLPRGEDGNTETGHLNLGAGSVVYQDLPRINQSIADGSFAANESLLAAIQHVKDRGSTLHLLGLVGSGGVHSNIEHLYALMAMARDHGVTNIVLDLITDGRDSPPTSGITYIQQVQHKLSQIGVGVIGSIIGRYYAMDRDKRWERTELAYRALTEGVGEVIDDPIAALRASYEHNVTDEFVKPLLVRDEHGQIHPVEAHDAVIFYNFRIDRPRQLTRAFVLPQFDSLTAEKEGFDPHAIDYHQSHVPHVPETQCLFERGEPIEDLFFVTMTEYEKFLPVKVAFPPELVPSPLSQVVADEGLRQLKMSETEKERFVTYYFNGQREDPFVGEDWIIIPSPEVPTYDQKPEMSSFELTDTLIERIKTDLYDLIVVNFAQPDMVAHTGNLEASIRACEVTDELVGTITEVVTAMGGVTVITADHGNAEELINHETGMMDTEHSQAPVPLIIVGRPYQDHAKDLPMGVLADVAPTILRILGIEQPQEMTGRSLL